MVHSDHVAKMADTRPLNRPPAMTQTSRAMHAIEPELLTTEVGFERCSRSFNVADYGTNGHATSYNTNLHRISHRFRDIAVYSSIMGASI